MPTDRPGRPDDDAVEALETEPHRRHNALTDEWVLVSAGRTQRPWLGAEEPEPAGVPASPTTRTATCAREHACDGRRSTRPTTATFVFTNDFAALRPDTSDARVVRPACSAPRARAAPAAWCASRPATTSRWRAWSQPRDPPRRRRVGGADNRARRALPLGPGVREPGRGDGRQQPAPARPDLGRRRAARSRPCASVATQARHHAANGTPAAGRLRGRGAWRAAGRGRDRRRLAHARPVLGGLAVRDPAHAR